MCVYATLAQKAHKSVWTLTKTALAFRKYDLHFEKLHYNETSHKLVWHARVSIWLTDISSQDVLYLFLLESTFDHQLVISIYGTTAKTPLKLNTKGFTVKQKSMQPDASCNIHVYLVPNSASKKAKRCFGCRCNLHKHKQLAITFIFIMEKSKQGDKWCTLTVCRCPWSWRRRFFLFPLALLEGVSWQTSSSLPPPCRDSSPSWC